MLSPTALTLLPEIPVALDGVTIEQLYVTPLDHVERGGSPRGDRGRSSSPRGGAASSSGSAPLVMTPRSAEACLQEGIDPTELRPVAFEKFFEGGVAEEFARLRFDEFERVREDKMRVVRAARAVLLADPRSPSNVAMKQMRRAERARSRSSPRAGGSAGAGDDGGDLDGAAAGSGSSYSPSGGHALGGSGTSRGESRLGSRASSTTPGRIIKSAAELLVSSKSAFGPAPLTTPRRGSMATTTTAGTKDVNAMVEQEKRRLESVQRKQQKEIAQFLQYEMAQVAIRQEAEAELARAAAEKEGAEAQKKLRHKLEAEARRERELKRKMDEEEEKRHQAALAAEEHHRLLSIAEEAARRKKEAQVEAQMREAERVRRQAEFKAMTAAKFERRQAELMDRLEAMTTAEAIRLAKLEEADKARKTAAEEKRKAAEARLRSNFENAKALEADRIARIVEKEEAALAKKAEKAAEEEAQKRHRAHVLAQEEAKRQEALAAAARAEEARVAALLKRQEEEAAALARTHDAMAHDHALKREQARLDELAKAEAIMRQKRKDEYHRLMVMRHVVARDSKMKEWEREKEDADRTRRLMAYQLSQQRMRVSAAFAKAKQTRNWRLAQEMVDSIMQQANATMAAALGSSGGDGTGSTSGGPEPHIPDVPLEGPDGEPLAGDGTGSREDDYAGPPHSSGGGGTSGGGGGGGGGGGAIDPLSHGEYTMRAEALARMLHQASQDFERTHISTPVEVAGGGGGGGRSGSRPGGMMPVSYSAPAGYDSGLPAVR